MAVTYLVPSIRNTAGNSARVLLGSIIQVLHVKSATGFTCSCYNYWLQYLFHSHRYLALF